MKKYLLIVVMLPSVIAMSQNLVLDKEHYGFRANWFESENKIAPTIIILGGSEGGTEFGDRWAPKLNKMGYNILAMAYFGTENLSEQLELIPLEYLDRAIEWLDNRQNNSGNKYGLIGVSKGAELALLQASRLNKFQAIIAMAPSSVIWQSINRKDFMSNQSSWILQGNPLPFLPYCYDKGYDNIFNYYDCALDNLDPNAEIKVEKINAPLLLVSGGDDKLWPSERMGNMIMEKLMAIDYQYTFLHKNYPTAGHWLVAPHITDESDGLTEQEKNAFPFLGGSPDELLLISAQVEHEVYEFLRRYLKGQE